MAQNTAPKRPRGRPRAYDPEMALGRAMDAFWTAGFSATSLDQLSEATGMNRPSLYSAFGDKQALYLKTLERYSAASRAFITSAFTADQTLREALLQVYGSAIDIYVAGEKGQRGCFFIGTAATEAATNPAVREVFAQSVRELDEAFEKRVRAAVKRGELAADADVRMLGRLATSVIHTLALRARAGEPRAALLATAKAAVALICGADSSRRKKN
jgi:TetR/AcrR family transcriptional regulator, copper-responsive repressor